MNYILDTNLVLIYLRGNELAKRLEANLDLLSGDHNLIISVVSVGELRSIAKRNKWGDRKIQYMTNTLSEFLIADINTEEILERYAEIDAFSQGKLGDVRPSFTARNMGKNDLWIAATASIYNIELLTTDNDFQHLKDTYLKLRAINLDEIV